MAVLTTDQLGEMSIAVSRDNVPVDYRKVTINAASQAVEDWFETTGRGLISAAINTATSPTVLTNVQKKAIVKAYLKQKYERGG